MADPIGPKGPMRDGIRRQGHDTWQIRVYNSAARRREYFTVSGTLKDARDARNRRLAQIAKGAKPPPKRAAKVTIRELCDEWLERKAATKEKKTVQQYEWCANHILHARYGLASAPVQTITVDEVQSFVDALVGRGLSPKSVKGIASALSQILKLARRKDLIRFNPAEDVELPPAKSKQVRPPSPAVIWAAIEKAMERGEPDRAAIIRLQAATGMRRGEVAGLRWCDVDIDGEPPQLTIERAIADLRGNGNGPPPREIKSTKTETGIRTIGIDVETAEVLREHRARTEHLAQEFGFVKLPADSFVFWPPREGPTVPYAPQSITKMYRTLAGEGGLRPHQLRHFSVTQLLAAGVPEVEVMGRHGHASASSMKPYRHYIRAKDRMSTRAISEALGSRDVS